MVSRPAHRVRASSRDVPDGTSCWEDWRGSRFSLSAPADDPEPASSTAPSGTAAAGGAVTIARDGTQGIIVVFRDDYVFLPASFDVTAVRVQLKV